MKKKTVYLIAISIFFSVLIFSGEMKKVKVTSALGNIRTSPGLIGEIIKTAQKGDSFILLEKDGTWYKIVLAVDKKGDPEFGYIHSSIVGIITEDQEDKTIHPRKEINPQEPVVQREYRQQPPGSVKKNRLVLNQKKLFSGSFLKGGIMRSPQVESFGDKWIVSWGFDKAIGKYMTWGFELQPYYRSFDSEYGDPISIKSISTNIFLNFKGGVNLGRFINKLNFLTLYAGGGIGTNLSYTHIDWDGVKGNLFDTNLAWHLMFGTEIKLGGMDIIIEIQSNKVIVKDVEPATQSYSFIFFGLRF